MLIATLDWIARHERPILVAAFLLIVAPLCSFLAVVNPVGQAPDEPAHVLRADALRHGALVAHQWQSTPVLAPLTAGRTGTVVGHDANGGPLFLMPWQALGAPIDPALLKASHVFHFMTPTDRVTTEKLAAARAIPWSTIEPVDFRNTAQYAPTLYIGAALALGIAQRLGVSPYDGVIGVRFINLLQFAILGTLALWIAAAGRLVMFCALTVPMILYLAPTASQDGPMIAATALVAALVSQLWLARTPAIWRLAVLTILLIAVITGRPTNAPLAVLLLLPQEGIEWRSRITAFIIVTLFTLGWSILLSATAVPLRPEAVAAEQIAAMRAYPKVFLVAAWVSYTNFWPDYVEQMVGRLGLLNLYLPTWMLRLYALLAVTALIGDAIKPVPGPRLRLVATLLIVIGGVGLVALAQYLTWTPAGTRYVDGIQGRYFLPLTIVCGLGVAGLCPLGARWPRGLAVLGVLAGPISGAIVIPDLILTRYYGP